MDATIIEACRTAGRHEPNAYGVCPNCQTLYSESRAERISQTAATITRAHPDGVMLDIEVTDWDRDRGQPPGLHRVCASCEDALTAERIWAAKWGDGAEYRATLRDLRGEEIDWPE